MNFKFFSVLALISVVAAQSDVTTPTASGTEGGAVPSALPSGAPGPQIPTCLTTCVAQSGCDIGDLTCVCTTNLQTITDCVTSSCNSADLGTAAQLQQQLCNAASGSMSAVPSVTGSATTEGSTSAPTRSSTPSVPLTRTTPSATLSTRPPSTSGTSSTSAPASTRTNAASQTIVAQGVWVMVASLIGLVVAA